MVYHGLQPEDEFIHVKEATRETNFSSNSVNLQILFKYLQ